MTTRSRNDERGFDRGLGEYSSNEKPLKLDRRDFFNGPITKSAESTIMDDRKAGFSAKLDKK